MNVAGTDPLTAKSWRVPPAQPAVLLLVVSAMAALNIYRHPSGPVRVFTLLLGAASLVMAIAWLRMFLVADPEGVSVRNLRRAAHLDWPDIERFEVVSAVRGGRTVRIVRHDGSYVEVPPSLLQPSLPTSKPKAEEQLKGVIRELQRLAPSGPAGGPRW